MNEIINIDQQLFLLLNNLGNEQYDAFWILISEKTTWYPLYLILLVFLYRKYGWKHFLILLVLIILGITLSDQLSNLFKVSFERLRPNHDPRMYSLTRVLAGGEKYSFYSAHASNSFCIAVFFALFLRNRILSLVLIFWACTVSYSRIYLGVHYPLDLVCGGFMGSVLAFVLFKVNAILITKDKIRTVIKQH